jgi:hypothetical protein
MNTKVGSSMNSLCRCITQTDIGYDFRVIAIPLCLIFLLNSNFHIIERKKIKNKHEHF